MILVFVFSALVYMQGVIPPGEPIQPGPITPPVTAPRPQPTPATEAPVGPPRVTTVSSNGNTTVIIQGATDEEIAHDATVAAPPGMDSGALAVAQGGNKVVSNSLEMPDWIVGRKPELILDRPDVKSINDTLRFAGLGVWLITLTLIVLKHLAGPFTGCDIMDLAIAFPLGVFFGAIGWFNQPLLRYIIQIVDALITVVINTPVKTVVTEGLSFNLLSAIIIAPILGIVYDLLAIWLIFKMWLQLAWLWILGTVAPIYITMTGSPFLGKYGTHWWHNWFGTLIDPVLIVAGMHIAKPFYDLLQGGPDIGAELGRILILLVLMSTLGWHQGAYRPQGVNVAMGALLYRTLHRREHPGSRSQLPPSDENDKQLPPAPPDVPGTESGMHFGTGGGTAGSWWKTARWAVA